MSVTRPGDGGPNKIDQMEHTLENTLDMKSANAEMAPGGARPKRTVLIRASGRGKWGVALKRGAIAFSLLLLAIAAYLTIKSLATGSHLPRAGAAPARAWAAAPAA